MTDYIKPETKIETSRKQLEINSLTTGYAESFSRMQSPRGLEGFAGSLLFLNFAVSFLRVQDLPGMSWVGVIKFPAIIATIVGLLWLARAGQNLTREGKMLIFFIFAETIRLLVGKFLDPDDTIVKNDFWQFQTIKDLLMQFSGLALPMIVFFPYRRCLNKFIIYNLFIGGFLGLWSVTHAGRGPGGFLGDENDFCLTLLYFLGISLAAKVVVRSGVGKVISIGLLALMFAGVIATQSRGGFLGLVALCGMGLLQSRYKMRALVGLLLSAIVALPFIPHKYFQEVQSIHTDYEAKESTITERLETWDLALKVWRDPPHILTGVGLQNTQWWFPNYEAPGKSIVSRSLAGRATHSMYFQILGDLGVWGIVFFLTVIGGAYRGNMRIRKEIGTVFKKLTSFRSEKGEVVDEVKPMLSELSHLDYLIYSTNCAWIAVLVAGIGISVFYYPTIWTLVGFSIALRWYWRKLFMAIEPALEKKP